ncbi:hypothetical protein ACFSUK_32385 [Sphingobium scionense]
MTKIHRSIRPFSDIAEFIAQETMAGTTDDFHAAFSSDLDGVRIGRGEEEMATDMPDPREAQLAVELIVTTLFDLLRDTRLQPAAERLAWGIVNSFHHVADQWQGQADKATRDVQDLLRRADGSEIHGVELEQAQGELEFLDEATDALRCMRDHAADVFHTETGRYRGRHRRGRWSRVSAPPRSSRPPISLPPAASAAPTRITREGPS